ncbi:MAG: hypothetical protein ACOC6K_04840 [Thermodesulfobacteriota bacterium]
MRFLAVKIFWLVLLTALILTPLVATAQQKTPTPPPAPAQPEPPPEVPDLAELILRANKLSNRLALLEAEIAQGRCGGPGKRLAEN